MGLEVLGCPECHVLVVCFLEASVKKESCRLFVAEFKTSSSLKQAPVLESDHQITYIFRTCVCCYGTLHFASAHLQEALRTKLARIRSDAGPRPG